MSTPHSTFILKKVDFGSGRAEYDLLRSMPEENGFLNDAYLLPYDRFEAWVARQMESSLGMNLPEGFVPQTTYWFYADGVPVGRAKLRHRLTDSLRREGGHIGYGIAPAHRGKGYAVAMLRLVLREARAMGIEQALVTIDEDNAASRAVAERCGGVLQDTEGGVARYWLAT